MLSERHGHQLAVTSSKLTVRVEWQCMVDMHGEQEG